jgi:LPXTG-site transpeptidase (sortase) family protein
LSTYFSNNKFNSAYGSRQFNISGSPSSISIDRLNINLPVAPGYYNFNTKKWTLDSKHVFTDNLDNANPIVSNTQTNVTVFYGHDIPGILVNTSNLVYGDILKVNTVNGYTFTYYYDHDKVVSPTDASFLSAKNTGDSVALMTCTGEFYQSRHVMYFRLISISKINSTQNIWGGYMRIKA